MESINEPQVVQNCDTLYKSDIVWNNDTTVNEKTEYEKNMLKDTKTPEELLDEERKEVCIKQIDNDQKEKLKSLLIMFKVITAHRLGYHPLINLSTLQPLQAERFKNNMESLGEDYNNGMIKEITDEFNRICNEKLFQCGADVSCYPVYS